MSRDRHERDHLLLRLPPRGLHARRVPPLVDAGVAPRVQALVDGAQHGDRERDLDRPPRRAAEVCQRPPANLRRDSRPRVGPALAHHDATHQQGARHTSV